MHAAARRAGRRGREGGRRLPLRRAPVERDRSSAPTGRCGACASSGGELLAADAVVGNADLPVAYRTLLPGVRRPAASAGDYSPSARGVARRRARRPARRRRAPQHPLRRTSGTASFRALLDDGRRMPDPSLLVSVPIARRADAGAARAATSLYVLEPVPNLDGQVDWTHERGRARDELAGRLERLGYPTDVEVEELVDPLDWEAQGMERGTPFALVPPLPPDRSVPAGQRRSAGARPRVRRVGHRARRGRADGAGVRRAGRRPGRRAAGVGGDRDLEASYARCRQLNKRYGTTYYWSTYALPRVKRHHVWALYAFCRHADDIVDDLGPVAGRRPRRRPSPTSATASSTTSRPARSDDPVLEAVVHTVRAFGIDPSCFQRFLALDDDGPHGHRATRPGTTCSATWTVRPR